MAPKREANRGDYRKLKTMLEELQVLKRELLPGDGVGEDGIDMKEMDDFQRVKHLLSGKLQNIRSEVDRLNEIRRAKGDNNERDAISIRMQNDNTGSIKEAFLLFNQLKELLKKDETKTGKKRLDEKELSDRRKFMQLFGEEIQLLTKDNSAVKVAVTSLDSTIQTRREKRHRAEHDRRRGRRHHDIDEDEFREVGPASEQEQLFQDKVEQNNKEIDEMLQMVSQGLDELKDLALQVNKELTLQDGLIDQVDGQLDKSIEQFQTANKRLKQILDESGGVTRWCPMLLCAVLLLALVGYMFKIV